MIQNQVSYAFINSSGNRSGFLVRLVRDPDLQSRSQGPIPASVCHIRLGELPRVLERDEAASTVVAGVEVTVHTAGKYDLVAFGSFHRLV